MISANKGFHQTYRTLLNHFPPIDVFPDCYYFRCDDQPEQFDWITKDNNGCPQFSERGPFTRMTISPGALTRSGLQFEYDQVEETGIDESDIPMEKEFSDLQF